MRWISTLMLALAAVLAACSGGESEPAEAGDGSSASAASQANGAAQLDASPRTLSTRPVEFTVELPEGTSAPVRVRVIGLHQFETVRDVQVHPVGSTTWAASVDLEDGALIRYRYERTDENTGSGAPLHNVEVSAGGMHTATGIEGQFVIPELAPGAHTLTMHRADGFVFARSIPVTVTAAGETLVEAELTAAAPVEVTFRIAMPADSPEGAQASLFGTAEQLGGWFGQAPNQTESLTQPMIGPTPGEVTYRANLYEGQHVLYRYNLGMVAVNGERSTTGEVFRQFVVSTAEPERRDVIETWRLDGTVFTTVRVRLPDNTPDGAPPLANMGPTHPLTARADGSYQATLVGWPGNRFEFSYQQGELEDADTAGRTVIAGETDSVIEHLVTGWVGRSGRALLSAGDTTEVLIRLSVSAADEGVARRLIGDAPLDGAELQPLADNPSILEARMEVPAGEWAFTVDDCSNVNGADAGGILVLAVDLERPTLDLWSANCDGAPVLAAREMDYIAGIYTPDLFGSEMPRLTESTYQSIEDAGGGAVALSSVLAYGQTLPTPTLERRPIFANSVMTPTWAMR